MKTPKSGKTGTIFAKAECEADLNDVKSSLGEEHFIEDDSTRTHSGIERFWIFAIDKDTTLAFQYFDEKNMLLIGSNQKGIIHSKLLQRFISFPTKSTTGVMWE